MSAFINLFLAYLPHLKGLGLLLAVFFFGMSLYYGLKTGYLALSLQRTTDAFLGSLRFRRRTLKAWKEITSHMSASEEREWKLAIIEADILLGETLDVLGIPGKGTGEKLYNLDSSIITHLDSVWEAHKLRNQIAHESTVELDRETANRALEAYRHAFEELGLI